MDRKYVLSAFGYGLLGLILGIYMAASKDHSQLVTHAHIMLVGFVVSFIYAVCHKLWLTGEMGKLASIQFYAHQVGTIVLSLSLFLLYSQSVDGATLGPILGISSILVLAAMIMMKIMYVKSTKVD